MNRPRIEVAVSKKIKLGCDTETAKPVVPNS